MTYVLDAVRSRPADPAHLSEHERLVEIASILAAGIVRLEAKRQIDLALSAQREAVCGHALDGPRAHRRGAKREEKRT